MNFVPCLTWVAKGIAKSTPDKLQLSPEELKNLIEETKDFSGRTNCEEDILEENDVSEGEIDVSDENVSDKEEDVSSRENDSDSNEDDTVLKEVTDEDEGRNDDVEDDSVLKEVTDEDNAEDETDDDEDFDSRYNLETYDDDGEDEPFMNITDVTTFIDNKEDDYITGYDAVEEDEKEDEEDFTIKETDNLLLVGHIEEESSVLEVYVHNKEEDALYVHHDIVLPAYPLALEWLDFHPSDEAPGNYVAVADMTSVIKIWDLDLVDILEPDFCLGKELKKKKMEKMKLKYHTDAVLSLSWNKHVRNILASGSADSSIIIWDLQEAKPLNKLTYHINKVQSLQWHPFESSFLLSGCTDGVVKLYDCRAPDSECKSWKIEGEIEKVAWNLTNPIKFLCSTDQGFVHSIDMKSDKIEHSIQAHSDAVTSLDMCPTQPNILVTGSMDKTIKIWDLQKLSHVRTQKLKVGSIYTAKFAPDSELTLAVGGNYKSNSLKVMDLEKLLQDNEEDEEPTVPVPKFKNKKNLSFSSNANGGRNDEETQAGFEEELAPMPKFINKKNLNSSSGAKGGRNNKGHQDGFKEEWASAPKFINKKNFNSSSNAKGQINNKEHQDGFEEGLAPVPKFRNKSNFNFSDNAKSQKNKDWRQGGFEENLVTVPNFINKKNFNSSNNAKGRKNEEWRQNAPSKPFIKKFDKFSQPKASGMKQDLTENFTTISASNISHSKKDFNTPWNFKANFNDNKHAASQFCNNPFQGKRIGGQQFDFKSPPIKRVKIKHANRKRNNHVYFTDDEPSVNKVTPNSFVKKEVNTEINNFVKKEVNTEINNFVKKEVKIETTNCT